LSNPVKEKLKAGQSVLGVWIEMMNAELIEFCGYLGFEYAMIDGEHFALDPRHCLTLVRACEVSEMVPIVRVPTNDPSVILSYLEVGCLGIYVPHVNSGDDAKAIVDAVKYAPIGHRGAGSGRYLRYNIDGPEPGEAQRRMNDDTMIVALVEEMRGIENLDAIIATEGIDVIGIGSGDLSHSMGHIGQKSHPEVVQMVDTAERHVAEKGKVFDSVVTTADEAREALERGSLMISVAVRGVLKTALGDVLRGARTTHP
jgi:4-hydroxy-2-oxoheptanedioate aldolase